MIHVRIHIGRKPDPFGADMFHVLTGCLSVKREADDSFGALESVFPRHDDSQRRPVLVRQRSAIHSEAKQCERMHRFIHPQSFAYRHSSTLPALSRHLLRVQDSCELHELSPIRRIRSLDQFAQGKAHPWHHASTTPRRSDVPRYAPPGKPS